eukprot:PITA_31725
MSLSLWWGACTSTMKGGNAFEALAFHTRGLSDVFYTKCFINGLKEAIKSHVQLHHPPTWIEACKVARNVERAFAALATRPNFTAKGRPTQARSTTQTLKVQKVSPVEMAERRKQGLCYYCDEKYSPGHKCTEPKFFQIDAIDYSSSKEDPLLEEPEVVEEDKQKDNVPDEPVISLHAVTGISSPQTLKIRGFIKHHPVLVLIDNGSTHNFIHQKVVEAVHYFVRAVSNFQVQIADGDIMKCEGRYENVKIQMGELSVEDPHVCNTHGWPHELPPSRGEHDHRITLVTGAQPPNVHPYRYPFTQKNDIEKIIKELSEAGVIRPSISPYSSPVVMVLKKDGEWRMCPDFRALNKLIGKDKFPIPVVDDLLEELNGAQFFTKLDLRLGYHQIRMKEVDIPKTAFRTHEGHYEFLVMPFGLCNAPSNFQSLMNHLLKPYLKKFVLVFFDDILIYSCTWATHLQHVDLLLQLLCKHQLFVKMSKCSFGMEEVE